MTGFGPDHTVEIPDRRARAAVAVLFLSNRALFAGLLPRYPEIKAQVGRVGDRGLCGGVAAESGQWAVPISSIVSTPAMINPMPSPMRRVSGSLNRNFAIIATSATPQADHTP